ncbi:MAG: uroporphyrinogen-III C-methyltransferase [Pseudomonadota bacterium]
MSDPIAPPPSSAPSSPPRDWLRWAVLALSIVSASGVWLAWNAQKRVQSLELELVRRQQDTQLQATEARLLARQAQDVSREAAARTTLLENRLAEVALQRSQVEDLIKSLTLSRDENLVVDIEAALRVAIQQSALTGSAEPLIAAMQSADERLGRARQPRLDNIRRAVAKDLDRLRATRVADLSSLSIRLDEAIRLVDELPLVSQPVDQNGRALVRPPAPPAKSAPKSATQPRAVSAAQPDAPDTAPALSDGLMAWAHSALDTLLKEAQALVRITRIRQPDSVLLAPDQAFFVRENLKLRLLNARLGLLSRQTSSVVADLSMAQTVLSKYFDPQSRKTVLIQSLLADVASQSPQIVVPRPDDSLAALAAVAGGR